MRNLLRRQPSADPKPTLRERFAATKAKYARTLAVHRALNKPLPAPAVDRVALVNYSTWLSFERERVCAELYPHLGAKASRFTLTMNAAERFFYPDGINHLRSRAWRDVPPASSRAVKVLDLVGVDWRQDLTDDSRRHFDASGRADTGERPPVPDGWPRLDAALLEALDDLARLDAAQEAMGEAGSGGERDADTVPGYGDLEDARLGALKRMTRERSDSLIGLQVKAKALLTDSVSDMIDGRYQDLVESLARDLLGASNRTIEPRPDPIFAAIEESQRLLAAWDAANRRPLGGDDLAVPADAAANAFFRHAGETLLTTVPRTPAGCAALCRHVLAIKAAGGVSLDAAPSGDPSLRILDLIARSPLL